MGLLGDDDSPQVLVEFAFGSGPDTGIWMTLDDPDRGVLDTAQLADDPLGDGFWVDVAASDLVLDISTRRGKQRLLEQSDTGTATITLDNATRYFDPTNLAGPYVSLGRSLIKPMKSVRVRAYFNGTYYPIYQGFADEWLPDWVSSEWSTTTLTVSDGFSVLGNFDPLESTPVGAGEDSGARCNRILDNAGWPTIDRNIDTGNSTLQATNLSQNALSELKLVADSERGDVFMTADGKFRFRRRHAHLEDSDSLNVQLWLDDAQTYSSTNQRSYVQAAIANDKALIRNVAQIARVGGVAQVVEDSASKAEYLVQPFTRTDLLLETDDECLDQANWIINQFSEPELRFDSVTIDMLGINDTQQELWSQVLSLDIGSRIRIVKRPPGGGDPIDRESWVVGISHDIVPVGNDGQWRVTLSLVDANDGDVFVLNSASLGVLDTNVLGY